MKAGPQGLSASVSTEPYRAPGGRAVVAAAVRNTRRAGYGANSPDIGRRGADTRTNILSAALRLFDRQGFFNTTIDDIVQDVGISRATLYQYFPGKSGIFFELLEVCGTSLNSIARQIGRFGPTVEGFDNLIWWLTEWFSVYQKYSTMFVQWISVAQADPVVRPRVDQFVDVYNCRISEHFIESDLAGVDPVTAAMVVTALVHRMNLFIHTGRTYGRDTHRIVGGLAVYLQLYLFPETPTEHLAVIRSRDIEAFEIPTPRIPDVSGLRVADRIAGRRRTAESTIRSLIDVGSILFRENGFHHTGVDDVTRRVGIARGTFYKYFDDKEDLLVAIGFEGADEAVAHARALGGMALDCPEPTALRQWLSSVSGFVLRQAGSIDVWTERSSDDHLLTRLGEYAQTVMDKAMSETLSEHELAHPLDPAVATLIFRSLVSRLPQAIRELTPDITDEDAATIMIDCLRRGFLGLSGPGVCTAGGPSTDRGKCRRCCSSASVNRM